MLKLRMTVAVIILLICGNVGYAQEKIQKENPSPSELAAVKEHEKATQLMIKGKYKEAIEPLEKAINLNPDFHEAYYNLGISYEHLGQYKKAIKALEEVVKLSPQDANVYYALGFAYYKKKKYKKAVTAFDRSISLKPNNAFAFSKLGDTYLAMGKKDKALEQYEILKRLDTKLADELYRKINDD